MKWLFCLVLIILLFGCSSTDHNLECDEDVVIVKTDRIRCYVDYGQQDKLEYEISCTSACIELYKISQG